MKKTTTFLILMIMLMTTGCMQKTPEEKIEEQGREKMAALKRDGYSCIKKLLFTRVLAHPESYKPISYDMEIVTNKMLIYDSRAFDALRNLNDAMINFDAKYGDNDSIPESAIDELDEIHTFGKIVQSKINELNSRPLQFEGIEIYHQFYGEGVHKNTVKAEYHFVVHEDGIITLLCNHDDFLRVQTLIKQWFDYPSYSKTNPDSLHMYLFRKLERIQYEDLAFEAENKSVKEAVHDILHKNKKAKM